MSKLIYKQIINKGIKRGIGDVMNLDYTSTFDDFYREFKMLFENGDTDKVIAKNLETFYVLDKHGNSTNYAFCNDFFYAIKKASDNLNLEKIPTKLLLSNENIAYQVSTPKSYPSDYVIRFKKNEEEFNLMITRFIKDIHEENDLSFWILRGNVNQTCEELLTDFLKEEIGTKAEKDELSNKFRLIINMILYINSGRPDLRHLKGHPKKGIKFEGKKRASRLRKYAETNFDDCFLVGFNFKKETYVNGHFRWQPYGPMSALRKLIWIDSFTKGSSEV